MLFFKKTILNTYSSKFKPLKLTVFISESFYEIFCIYNASHLNKYEISLKESFKTFIFNYSSNSILHKKSVFRINKSLLIDEKSVFYEKYLNKSITGIVVEILNSNIKLFIDKYVYGFLNFLNPFDLQFISLNSFLRVYVCGLYFHDGIFFLHLVKFHNNLIQNLLTFNLYLWHFKFYFSIHNVNYVILNNKSKACLKDFFIFNRIKFFLFNVFLNKEKIKFIYFLKSMLFISLFFKNLIFKIDYKNKIFQIFCSFFVLRKIKKIFILFLYTSWNLKLFIVDLFFLNEYNKKK